MDQPALHNGSMPQPNETTNSPVGDDPNQWLSRRFPEIAVRYGDALLLGDRDGQRYVRDFNEDFLAAIVGEMGTPAAPTVFVREEARFYTYTNDPKDQGFGIYVEVTKENLISRLSAILLECARQCQTPVDTSALEFRLRSAAKLHGVIQKAKGLLAVTTAWFDLCAGHYLACANGVLDLERRELHPFLPCFRLRHKLTVAYDPSATCPTFLKVLMIPALAEDDLDLVQLWCGLAIAGKNLAQVILVLVGTAGGGKGTFTLVVAGILGERSVAGLRPKLLEDRFEIGRLQGRTLLYGPDVPANFLNHPSASVLKSLVGGDPLTTEVKNSNDRTEIKGSFNCLLTCNSRLTVRLEGDADAWRRRLRIVTYSRPRPQQQVADLAAKILRDEGSGALNWMLEGMDRLRKAGWQIDGNAEQRARVDDLLAESDSVEVFVREALKAHPAGTMTVGEAFARYVNFCGKRGWSTVDRKRFNEKVPDAVARRLHLSIRNDIPDHDGRHQRGWKGVIECV